MAASMQDIAPHRVDPYSIPLDKIDVSQAELFEHEATTHRQEPQAQNAQPERAL